MNIDNLKMFENKKRTTFKIQSKDLLEIIDDLIDSFQKFSENFFAFVPYIEKFNNSAWAQYSVLAKSEKERNNLTKFLIHFHDNYLSNLFQKNLTF